MVDYILEQAFFIVATHFTHRLTNHTEIANALCRIQIFLIESDLDAFLRAGFVTRIRCMTAEALSLQTLKKVMLEGAILRDGRKEGNHSAWRDMLTLSDRVT